jgi:hypothetical protein
VRSPSPDATLRVPGSGPCLGIGESHQLGVLQRFRLPDRAQLLMVSRWRLSIATMASLQVLHRSKPQKSASATHRGRFKPRERHCSSTRDERAARARHSQCAVRAPSVAAIRFSAPLGRSGASRFRDFSLMRELDPPANASPRRVPTGDAKGQG